MSAEELDELRKWQIRSSSARVSTPTNITTEDIDSMGPQELERLFNSLKLSSLVKINRYYLLLESDLFNKIVPTVPEVLNHRFLNFYARNMRKAFDEYMTTSLIDLDAIKESYELKLKMCKAALNRQGVLSGKRLAPGSRTVSNSIWQDAIDYLESELRVMDTFPRIKQLLLQGNLMQLILNESEALRSWFWKGEMAEFHSHIKLAKSTLPLATIDFSASAVAPYKLPLEVMEMIYTFADLETCITLRQLNKRWYAAFQNERLMESKMRERSLWIKPGDPDLKTWADCVLVFASRLQSGKWVPFSDLDKDLEKLRGNQTVEKKILVGISHYLGEKLPADFKGMMDKREELGLQKTVLGEPEYFVDPWTYKVRRSGQPHEVVRSDENGTVIRFEGVEITLDPSVRPHEISHEYQHTMGRFMHVGDYAIFIPTKNRTGYVFPRDKPHFKHALKIDRDCEAFWEAGDIFLLKKQGEFSLVDLATKKTVLLDKNFGRCGCDHWPAASYNGLLWTAKDDVLFPTFVDLENPEVAYYRADRAIFIGSTDEQEDYSQGSKSRGLGQFVFRKRIKSTLMIDLASGVCTSLEDSHGWTFMGKLELIAGFKNGEFQLRHFGPRVLRDLYDRVYEP